MKTKTQQKSNEEKAFDSEVYRKICELVKMVEGLIDNPNKVDEHLIKFYSLKLSNLALQKKFKKEFGTDLFNAPRVALVNGQVSELFFNFSHHNRFDYRPLVALDELPGSLRAKAEKLPVLSDKWENN
mgnify:CR=1 FL=1